MLVLNHFATDFGLLFSEFSRIFHSPNLFLNTLESVLKGSWLPNLVLSMSKKHL